MYKKLYKEHFQVVLKGIKTIYIEIVLVTFSPFFFGRKRLRKLCHKSGIYQVNLDD
jgi:hypothetical protein